MRLLPTIPTLACLLAACGGGGGGSPPPPVPDEPTILGATQDPPGVVATILSVSGGSGFGGFFRPGDRISVRFTLEKAGGARWNLHEMDFAGALASGPGFNYQPLLPERTDVFARSVQQSDGSYVYAFEDVIPAQYPSPANDSPSFDVAQGELAGEDLRDGTYTVGLAFAWDYTMHGQSFRDAGNATADFRLGGSAVLAHREVVRPENCDRCHVDLRYHEGRYRDAAMCVLCHTAGAEDRNDPMIEGGTLGVSIDFKVMMHKLHNGAHLPSVHGITTDRFGARVYTGTSQPYRLVDAAGIVHDYSNVAYPVFPTLTIPFLKDTGWSLLSDAEKAADLATRTGVTDCSVCHGDPDGTGPAPEPAQGILAYAGSSREACGSCHDEIVWDFLYIANQAPVGMPGGQANALCNTCHAPLDPDGASGGMSVGGGHTHALKDPFINKGLNLEIVSLVEAGTNDGDGTIDPGEKIRIAFTMKDDSGAEILPNVSTAPIASIRAIVSGPTTNANQVLVASIPKAILSNLPGAQPFGVRLPELVQVELVGQSTPVLGDSFTTARAPHLNVSGAKTEVRVRTGTSGGSSALAADTAVPQNFVDVDDPTGFARDDFVVVDDGTPTEEYARIQLVDVDRLWFSSPASPGYPAGLHRAHMAGATVMEVSVQQVFENVHFDVDENAGTITELSPFPADGAVLVTYTTDFVMPATYGLALNASPDLDDTTGKWTSKSLVPGTYTLALTGYRDATQTFFGETNALFGAAPAAARDFLVGSAASLEPYSFVSSGSNCYACHTDLWYHDGQARGFEACIACHGQAGSEDRPRYVAASAPDTGGVTVNFRTLLHQIHRGKLLANASTFEVIGAGPTTSSWPDNYTAASYASILFPPMPGRTMQCEKCHGAGSTAWLEPSLRDHPTQQIAPVLGWKAVCATCHDSLTTTSHVAQHTLAGEEQCATCHAPGTALSVETAHKAR